ncbi:DUF3990 domain-containing protein [Amedibacillus dolichus]|uniref:DUF3990 domain-containing protein n=1 Tax=Amedibacillus dolichus TaxID=31971 RepID=UPI00241EEE83|nr:DUF3990 domain-containing protein [Amedibacillus dolichus]
MCKIILYHGSNEKIENPVFGKGKAYNDYGRGFYCSEHIELAKEWSCNEGVDGFANRYELDTSGLKILNLSSEEYTILHWLALLVENRRFRISTPVMRRGIQWLRDYFLLDISEYDLIIGYRADDSYFSFARAFISNEISLNQLNYAMRLGKLGEQYVLKSEKAFKQLVFKSAELADNTIYYARRKTRDDDARNAFFTELEKEDVNGIYMRDIIREEMKSDDVRLR